MKLLSCHINRFGCLQDFDLVFEEGVTLMNACNGFGKTTLAEFLRAMFYGFPRSVRDPEKNSRKKYAPWEGGLYGGILRFSHKGKVYRVHRTFGDTPRQDRFLLIDETTGQISRDFSQDLGLELFGLDADSFARSTYFPQIYPQGEPATGGLLARLGCLMEDTGDLQSFDKAIRTLRASRSACVPYKGTGGIAARASEEIRRLQLQIRDLEQQRVYAEAQVSELAAVKQALRENRAMEETIQGEILEASRLASQDALYRQYRLLTQQLQTSEAELSAITERYPAGLPTRQELMQVQKALQESKAPAPDPALTAFFAPGVPEDEFVNRCQNLLQDIRRAPKKTVRFLPAMALLLGGIFFLPLILPLGIGLLLCSLLGTVLALTQEKALSRKKRALQELLAPYFGNSEDYEQNLLTLQTNLSLYRLQKTPRENDANPVAEAFAARYGLSHIDLPKITDIFEDQVNYAKLLQQRDSQKEALKALCPQGIPQKPPKAASEDALKMQLEAVRQEIARCTSDIARLEQTCARLQEQLQALPELQDALLRHQAEKEQAIKTSRLLDLTMEFLQSSRQSLSGRYMQTLKERFGHYMSLLLQEDPQGIFVSDTLQVLLHRAGEPRSVGCLSKGQADLTEFSMRLALADTLFPQDKPLLILDDPFVNLDNTHREAVFSLLKKLSGTYQILYLTCTAPKGL